MSYRYNPLSGKIEFVGISTADGTSLEATINEKVANLVDSAPTTLDTLNELAAALNNDPNFATSTATLIGTKADTTSLSSVATSGAYADLTGKPSLFDGDYSSLTNQPDLFDGDYDSLTNKPSLFDGDYDSLTNKPSLFDGDYGSLTNTPSIPAAQVQSDYNQSDSSAVDFIKNKPSLFDGDYDSLTNKPSLFDGDYGSLSNQPDLFDGDYDSLTNKPTLFDGDYDTLTNKPTLFDGDYGSLSNQPSLFSGAYTDLSGKPTIPAAQVQSDYDQTDDTAVDFIKNKPTLFDGDYGSLTNTPSLFDGDYGSLTNTPSLFDGDYDSLSNKPSLFDGDYGSLTNTPTIPTVPTQISSFTNDSGYITGYTVTQDDISSLNITEDQITDLGTYLVASDLSTYALTTYVDAQVAGVVNSAPETLNTLNELATALGNDPDFATSTANLIGTKANTADLSAVATSGAYTDLIGVPSIPAAQVQSDYNQSDSSAVDFIKNKPTLFDGAYSSLSGAPTNVSAFANDSAYLTTVSFDDLSSSPTTISGYGITDAFSGAYGDLTGVPTNVSTFANDSGYLTSVAFADLTSKPTTIAGYGITDAFDGAYSSLSGAPTNVSDFANDSGYLTTISYAEVTGKPTLFDGAYSSLSGAPTNVSTFANDSGYLTTVAFADLTSKPTTIAGYGITDAFDGDYDNLSNKPTIPTVPTALSSFTNDENFINLTESRAGLSVSTGSASGSGSLNYTDSTGVLTFSPADLSSYLVASDLSTYALKTYVDAQVAGVVSSAPETLDTLNELAAALGDDPNFATTVSNQIGTKAAVGDFSVSTVAASGAGSLNYNDAGAFTFAPADLSSYLTDYTVTQSDVKAHEASLAIQGSQISNLDYNTLDNLPTIPEGADLTGYATETYVNSQGFITGISFANVSAKPTTIAGYGITDAFSGAYGDLTGAPTLFNGEYSSLTGSPTNLSDFANDTNFITLAGVSVSTGSASGSGSLNYDNSTGVFSFAPADLSSFLTSASLSGLASETYVNTQVANIVSSAPETLNTLNELADALGDDPNFATTISNQIGQKAALGDIVISTGSASGSGSLNYSIVEGEGVFTFTPPDLSSYLTSFTEDDPIFRASVASGITSFHIQNWNTAYTWGDHSTVGYLTTETQSDYNQTDSSAADFIKNKPTIPTVPTNVSDFSNDAGYLTSQTQVDFNQSDTNAVDFIKNKPTIPTALSDLTNDENFISAGGLSVSLGGASGSGSLNYNSSTGVFTFTPADLSGFLTSQIQADYNQTDSSSVDFIKNKPTLFDGDYTNLTNQPTIPTNNNELTNGAGYLALVSAPSTSKGASGDAAGDVAMDDNYIYRCTANYTDGVADIWKRVEFSTDTW
mgnify:CR=1 FL=1